MVTATVIVQCSPPAEDVACDMGSESTIPDNISWTPSVRSIGTLVSGTSHSTKYHLGTRSGSLRDDDMRSEVPTISESIADLQDLQEIEQRRTGHAAELGWHRSTSSAPLCPPRSPDSEPHLGSSPKSSCAQIPAFGLRSWSDHSHASSSTLTIDNRPHPLAPINSSPSTAGFSSEYTSLAAADRSDVPTIRDDMSTVSAPSEICVNFAGVANDRNNDGDSSTDQMQDGSQRSQPSSRGIGASPVTGDHSGVSGPSVHEAELAAGSGSRKKRALKPGELTRAASCPGNQRPFWSTLRPGLSRCSDHGQGPTFADPIFGSDKGVDQT